MISNYDKNLSVLIDITAMEVMCYYSMSSENKLQTDRGQIRTPGYAPYG